MKKGDQNTAEKTVDLASSQQSVQYTTISVTP